MTTDQTNTLDLTTELTRPRVTLPDGGVIELRHPEELSPREQANHLRMGRRMQQLLDGSGRNDLLNDREAGELDTALRNVLRIIVADEDALARVDALTAVPKLKVIRFYQQIEEQVVIGTEG